MNGERRPSPETQVRAALLVMRRDGLPADEAWKLATNGQVCDSYKSARGDDRPTNAAPALDGGPPNLRASDSQKRCAGCRFVMDAGQGPARCGLYGVPVYSGVLWPHRTDDRRQWKEALTATALEWQAAYIGLPSPHSNVLDILARVLTAAVEQHDGETGSIAA